MKNTPPGIVLREFGLNCTKPIGAEGDAGHTVGAAQTLRKLEDRNTRLGGAMVNAEIAVASRS